MQKNKYLTEGELFDAVGDTLIQAMLWGMQDMTQEERAGLVAVEAEKLTAAIWENTPRLSGVTPSAN